METLCPHLPTCMQPPETLQKQKLKPDHCPVSLTPCLIPSPEHTEVPAEVTVGPAVLAEASNTRHLPAVSSEYYKGDTLTLLKWFLRNWLTEPLLTLDPISCFPSNTISLELEIPSKRRRDDPGSPPLRQKSPMKERWVKGEDFMTHYGEAISSL